MTVTLSGQPLTIEKLVRIARDAEQVEPGSAAVEPGHASGSRVRVVSSSAWRALFALPHESGPIRVSDNLTAAQLHSCLEKTTIGWNMGLGRCCMDCVSCLG